MGADNRRLASLRSWVPTPFRKSSQSGAKSMTGKFVLKKNMLGKFQFNLVASNGQVIATSETYNSKAAAENGIRSVKDNAPSAPVDDQT
jgi:uncharacterized protein YegP (UPF0339 family)